MSRRRTMNLLIAAQVALCFLVQILAGLFVATFLHLSHQPTGFLADGVLALETATQYNRPASHWQAAVEQLRSTPGVTSAAVSEWAPMTGNVATGAFLVNGSRHGNEEPYILAVSPGWFNTMRIPLLAGRDFRVREAIIHPAVVNVAFARHYFNGENPVGRTFQNADNKHISYTVIGYVADSRYAGMREPLQANHLHRFRAGRNE